ncbi:MAG: hypothetical protein UC708_03730 [Anaerovoracaceae bacterium]|nr:hypothetical protein [Bacillota bacterium]MEE0516972.1 hypothetical protein [Anaerovoracaceae bacterium]
MKKKSIIIFLTLMIAVMACLTGCSSRDEKDMKDMIEDDTDMRTEEEREGDSSNLNQGVVEPEDGGVIGDATDSDKADDDMKKNDDTNKDDDKSNE